MKFVYRIVITILIGGIVSSACNVIFTEEDIESVEVVQKPINSSGEPQEEDLKVSDPKFTMTAENELRPALTLLYDFIYPGAKPVFVEQGGDLIVTHEVEAFGEHPPVPAAFLPDAYLRTQSNSTEVHKFMTFATSDKAERVLIEGGMLPSTVTVTDQAGNILEIEQPIGRVISTYGPTTSFIYSVNAQDRLVSASYLGARDPFGASMMKKMDPRFPDLMGDDFFTQDIFNIEQGATLDPNLIVTSARTSWLETAAELGFPVILYDAETPERLEEAMRLTGQLFGPRAIAYADTWINYYHHVVETITEQTATLPDEVRPRVLFTGTQPFKVAGGGMYQTDIIELAGGISVSSDLSGYWPEVNIEQIAVWNPDVIIVPPYGGATVEAITESAEWQILDAVQAGRVYRMPKLVVPWDTPAPDSVLGIVWMAQLLNPETVSLTCTQEAEYFYKTFYNYEITEDELATICKFE